MLIETKEVRGMSKQVKERPINFETVEEGLGEVKRLIDWLGYIAEHEYSETEKRKLISVSRKFAVAAQPIASKYID